VAQGSGLRPSKTTQTARSQQVPGSSAMAYHRQTYQGNCSRNYNELLLLQAELISPLRIATRQRRAFSVAGTATVRPAMGFLSLFPKYLLITPSPSSLPSRPLCLTEARGVHPPEAMMHFPLFQISPNFPKKLSDCVVNFPNLTFSKKCSDFHPQKFLFPKWFSQ